MYELSAVCHAPMPKRRHRDKILPLSLVSTLVCNALVDMVTYLSRHLTYSSRGA